jgi:EAL domain-containing protein (putative c-di-GMP-specific phosphodiesterase class I)/GGDEF domain-containing protein
MSESFRPVSLTIAELLAGSRLSAVFQPICSLLEGEVFGYEGLIRGPVDSELHRPDRLFEAARLEGNAFALEVACAKVVISCFDELVGRGRLFINFSAGALVRLTRTDATLGELQRLIAAGPPARKLVVEITEHDRVSDFAEVVSSATSLRKLGVAFALDDFGDGRSSLRLWAELQPEFVKIDKYFTHGAGAHFQKTQMLRAVAQISDVLGGRLIAEGIETADELTAVRSLGIELGQGYLLGRPNPQPATTLAKEADDVIARGEVAVLPAARYTRGIAFDTERLTLRLPPVSPKTTAEEVSEIFRRHPEYPALAVVDKDKAIGLINRRNLMEIFARPFQKEVYGNKSCVGVMNREPVHLEYNATFDDSMSMLVSNDQSYLTDGFIVSQGGRYVGIGTGEKLVRTVTEYRVEAARHANPLTFFPGNVPITEHIQNLIATGNEFVCAYCDLNHFKPFNDQYGYWQGDAMILLLADIIFKHAAPRRDFVGHVGGDDFIVLFQSENWFDRCEQTLEEFNRRAGDLFDPEARARGGIAAEDRSGNPAFFPITTLAIGAVTVKAGEFREAADVASAAAVAKRQAKKRGLGLVVLNASGVQQEMLSQGTESIAART